MREGHQIGRYMPKEIEPWKSSATIRNRMRDYQRSWFDELLMTGWANAEMPCHVPNNEDSLWKEAGAHSKMFFELHRAVVMSEFRVCGQGRWICNGKSLELYLQKLATYYRTRKKEPDAHPTLQESLFFLRTCSCISEEKKKLLGIVVVLDSFDPEEFLTPLKAIGFRGSTSTLVEQYYMREIESQYEESQRPRREIAAYIHDRCRRIYELTESGAYAPKLFELLSGNPRSYREADHLWERRNGKTVAGTKSRAQLAIEENRRLGDEVDGKDHGAVEY